jgi:hypothetical protein
MNIIIDFQSACSPVLNIITEEQKNMKMDF